MNHTGHKIRFLRESQGWSREQLAEKVSQSAEKIARTEQGRHKLTIDEVERYCDLFGVEPSYFFTKSTAPSSTIAGEIYKSVKEGAIVIDQPLVIKLVDTLDRLADFFHNKQL